MQEIHNSNTLDLCLSCTNPSICALVVDKMAASSSLYFLLLFHSWCEKVDSSHCSYILALLKHGPIWHDIIYSPAMKIIGHALAFDDWTHKRQTFIPYPYRWAMYVVSRLTHSGRVTHICVSKLTIIGSDNGLSPGRRQAIIWTNAGILLIGTLGTDVSEILVKTCTFSLKKMLFKMLSGKRRPSCLSLNVLEKISTQCYNSTIL